MTYDSFSWRHLPKNRDREGIGKTKAAARGSRSRSQNSQQIERSPMPIESQEILELAQ